jgi:hypothetical protein
MRILGVSLGTILLVLAVIFIVRKYGDSIPVVNSVG